MSAIHPLEDFEFRISNFEFSSAPPRDCWPCALFNRDGMNPSPTLRTVGAGFIPARPRVEIGIRNSEFGISPNHPCSDGRGRDAL